MVGDVVLAPFPFTDLSQVKIRPAVIVADVGMHDWILCEVTSSTRRRNRSIVIEPDDMADGRLRFRSWARPDRLATLNDRVFEGTLGRLTDSKSSEIVEAVRGLF